MDARSRTIALVTLAAGATGVAGCGGGDGGSGALSRKQYIARADQICRDSNRQILKIPAPKSAPQVVSYVNRAVPLVDQTLKRLKALEPESGFQADAAQLVGNLGLQRNIIRDVGAAAKKRDVKELTAVTKRGAQIAQTTEQRAKTAGFKVCGIQQGRG
jgi:hypothetical protein